MPSEFLNSKSMLTPGVAGAMVMLIANSLGQQFDLPLRWTALVLAFVMGTIVFADKTALAWQRAILYLLNSLLIFSIAVGSNTLGKSVTADDEQGLRPGASSGSFFADWFPQER
jgi:uncharacterized membrane protein YkvI